MAPRFALSSLIGLFVSTMVHTGAAGQTASTTETQWIEEADAHIQFASQWRVLALAGGIQAQNYPFQQWYAAVGLGYQFKPIALTHPKNIDPDKEFHFVFGAGYEHLDTSSSGTIENRIALEATPGYNFPGNILVRDRNRLEFRWINGKYATTYRNMLMVEHEFRIGGFQFSPYASFEAFLDSTAHATEDSYNGIKHSWNQFWYTAGLQFPYKQQFMVQTYYRRKDCTTCTPTNWNAWGITVNFYFDSTR